jgi:hypothetical protein
MYQMNNFAKNISDKKSIYIYLLIEDKKKYLPHITDLQIIDDLSLAIFTKVFFCY